MRARELGITIGTGRPGPGNAITDVAGVRVGHATLVRGDAVRTGVTVLFPSLDDPTPSRCSPAATGSTATGS
jgi:D-aminopeptidase